MTRPLREMTAAREAMARRRLHRRVATNSRDEVGQLASAFNSMATDLPIVDIQRRELVANVSHELRTPMAALRAAAGEHGRRRRRARPGRAGVRRSRRPSGWRAWSPICSTCPGSRRAPPTLHIRPIEVGPFLEELSEDARCCVGTRGADLRHGRDRARGPRGRRRRGTPAPGDLQPARQRVAPLARGRHRHACARTPTHDDVVIDVIDEGHGIPESQRDQVFGGSPAATPRPRPAPSAPAVRASGWRSPAGPSACTAARIVVADPPWPVSGTRIRVHGCRLDGPGTRRAGDRRSARPRRLPPATTAPYDSATVCDPALTRRLTRSNTAGRISTADDADGRPVRFAAAMCVNLETAASTD